MVYTKKFSEFDDADLTDANNELVGLSDGLNAKSRKIVSWTTVTRPDPAVNGLIGYNTTLSQYEFFNANTGTWFQLSINSGVISLTGTLHQVLVNGTSGSAILGAITLTTPQDIDTTSNVAFGTVTTSGAIQAIGGRLFSGSIAGGFSGGIGLFSPTAAMGSLQFVARDNFGNFGMVVTNATIGQVSTITIPDPVASTANFILSSAGAIQHITAFGLQVDAGAVGSGIITGGSPGRFVGFSPTASKGTLSLLAADSVGNFANTLTNASTAAARTWTLPDATGTIALTSDLTGFVTSVSGTANRITSTGGTTPIIDISASYVGQSSITTLGTIATGVWQGTLISATYGGTGLSNPTAHGVMIAEGASAMTPIVLSSGQILIGSTGIDPVAAAINSGTGILVANGAGSITVNLAAIADHTLLANISGGSLAPSSTTLTALIDNAIGSTQGNILYRNATAWVVLAPSTAGFALVTGGAAANPSWTSVGAAYTASALTKTDDTNVTLTLGGTPATALLQATSLTLGWTGQLAVSRGGTGISSFGTGVATALGINVGTAGSFVVNGGALGTPSSGTLTNATGLPIGGITGLGTGVATALAANVNGSGAISLTTSPTLVTPILGAASATSINFGGATLSNYTDSTFTPTMTCGSPGDLSVAYANQTGIYVRIGSMVYINVRIQFTPTFVTASGQVQFPGLPFACQAGNGIGWSGSVSFFAGGPTWPVGTTSISVGVESGSSFCTLTCLGSAVAGSFLQMSGLATGVQYHLVFSAAYHV